jgi:hypothetical protein
MASFSHQLSFQALLAPRIVGDDIAASLRFLGSQQSPLRNQTEVALFAAEPFWISSTVEKNKTERVLVFLWLLRKLVSHLVSRKVLSEEKLIKCSLLSTFLVNELQFLKGSPLLLYWSPLYYLLEQVKEFNVKKKLKEAGSKIISLC